MSNINEVPISNFELDGAIDFSLGPMDAYNSVWPFFRCGCAACMRYEVALYAAEI